MGIGTPRDLVGEWELVIDLPSGDDVRGHALFEMMGEVLVQQTTFPVPDVPDSCCVVVLSEGGGYVQHYFDSRGVARLYAMTFDGRTWTLERTKPDFAPLDFCQRFVATLSDDDGATTIEAEWLTSDDGEHWSRDFALTYTRVATVG
jgi:hypothetical protein